MSYPREHIIDGLSVILEPTGPNTHSLWLSGQQPSPETFYALKRIGRNWYVTRYLANEIGIAYQGVGVGCRTSKGEAMQLAVADFTGRMVAA